MNPGRPPLPPNKPYRWPFNYPEYVKNSNPDVHVRVLKAAIKANGETKDVKFVNMFSFTLKNTMFNWCNNYMGDYLKCIFVELHLIFYKQFRIIQNDEQIYLQLKDMK
jgi:hypothetical protein